MISVSFLCTGNSARSQMAAGFALAIGHKEVMVASAVTHPETTLHPLAVLVMAEAGVDISHHKPNIFSNLKAYELHIVITLCANAARECTLLLPGHPTQVNWNIPDPAEVKGSEEEKLAAFRQTRDQVRQLVHDLFGQGYLDTLAWANNKANLILNSLSEGIIVHDMKRKIIFFNNAAERITGYSREEVVGHDCHDVFPGSFCRTECSFRDECSSFDNARYPLTFSAKSGDNREIEMSVQAIKDDHGKMFGVLASFRDLTHEHHLARRLGEVESFSGIIGRDRKMLEVFDLIRSVADSNVPVLIQGASGTGKELVAAAIHNESSRANNLFVPVNCGALPEGLLESEIFGHVRGAFTGATRDKKGRFELADGGTILLDEIGDISPLMQVKLLRVLQEGTFERVGDTKTIHVDVRVISATNKDIKKEIADGRFREDLYYRLCVVPVQLPTLSERCGDIPLLVEHIIERIAKDAKREEVSLSPTALDILLSYDWPGNIRELQNALQFALVKCRSGLIEANHLPPHIALTVAEASTSPAPNLINRSSPVRTAPALLSPRPDGERGSKLTAEVVETALQQTGGNKAKAARILGVGRATLYRFLDKRM